jgi:hypothetical protein
MFHVGLQHSINIVFLACLCGDVRNNSRLQSELVWHNTYAEDARLDSSLNGSCAQWKLSRAREKSIDFVKTCPEPLCTAECQRARIA